MAASRRRTKSIRLAIPDIATLDALHNVDGSKCYDEADLRGIELIRPEVAAQHSEYERNAVGRELLRRLWPYEDEWIQKTHWIATKEGKLSLLVWKPAQSRLYELIVKLKREGRFIRVIILKARQIGFCYDASMRVLTADLRWVRIGDITVGTEVVAVDEDPPGGRGSGRSMRRAVVEAKRTLKAKTVRIKMEDGREIICTPEHRHLSRLRSATGTIWRKASKLVPGDVIRYITTPWGESDTEDGWFGGMLDGEGHMTSHTHRTGLELNCCQREGPVWDRVAAYLNKEGVRWRAEWRDAASHKDFPRNYRVGKACMNRTNEVFRIVGKCRPTRFLGRDDWWVGRSLPGKCSGAAWARVVSVEDAGEREVVDLQTSARTYICEGFVSHNSTLIQSLQYEWCDANPNRIALTIAHVDKSSIELFRKSKTIHRRLWFPRSTERDASGVFEFSDPHSSSFFVFTAGNPDAGASQTFHHGHLSELPRWPNPSETLTSMAPAIAPTLDSSVFIESTAQGAIGEFYERWIRAEQGKGDYVPFFAPWFEEPKYASPFADDEHRRLFLRGMSTEDREYQTRYKLSPEQMRWRRYQIDTELNGSEARFRQEYPSNAMEAFLTSGMPVFNPPEHILDLRAQCAKPQWTGDLVLTRA